MTYTEKQKEVLKLFKEGKLRRLNILHGSIRSGKTWISLVLWAFWVAISPKDMSYLMVAKTLTSLKRNCLDLLEALVGRKNFTYSISQKQAELFGRKIYLEGVNDARAESKIRGMTLMGAYCDELTLFTEDFFSMLLSRLSEPGAKLFGTTNPDNPNHWLKRGYIDRADELNMLNVKFLIDENTTLDPTYVKQIKAENQGVFYDRFILGEWVVAEGLVYPFFSKEKHCFDALPEGDYEWFVSVDYGTQNPFAMHLWAFDEQKGVAYVAKEYYYDGREKRRLKTDADYYNDLFEFCKGRKIENIIIDPSAASFKAEIRSHGYFSCMNANNAVIDGIRNTASYLQAGKIYIQKDCEKTIKEFGIYSWDDKSTEDKVIKENDHAMDSIRYMVHTVLKKRMY